ncbi:MAG: FAD-dependent oxidoreductase [Lentisphaeria bacterium]|nr:FAD-dependent oxidoreductase [Lentisphaeria bacterium]
MEQVRYKFDREIPVVAETDVLVVGGGPGGVCAGVMSARQGVRTLVVERYGCLGGMAVFGEVTPFMGNHVDDRSLDRPVYIDWCRDMQKYRSDEVRAKFPFDEEKAAGMVAKDEAMLAMEDLLIEAGAKLLYHHMLVDVIREDGRIALAVFHSKSGLCAVRAKQFVDATGDGDLAVLAGCPFEFGNQDGFCQPMTTCFKLSGVDRSVMPDRAGINKLYDIAKAEGRIDCPRENVLWFLTPEDDVIHFNTTRIIRKSGVNGVELSEAEIEGRRQIRQFVDFLRSSVPGFAHARIHSIAHHIGIRESRRILGLVYQTSEDFMKAAKYPDGVAKVRYSIDIHNPSGSGTTLHTMPPGDWYEIRYGALIPRNSRNLLMGCRAISLDHALHSSARVMPPVCSIGQAAGMAAAMCVRENCEPSQVDGVRVRKALADAGAWL